MAIIGNIPNIFRQTQIDTVERYSARRLAKEPLQQSAEHQQAPGISDARQALQAMKQDEVGL